MVIENHPGFFKRNLPVALAFIIPVIIMSVIFIIEGVYPFGEEMYLRSDCYHQYAPFLRQLQRVIQEGGSLSYAWDIGLGSNFASTYAYYLASPLNWVIALFGGHQIPMLVDIFIVLKCGLMGGTFSWYLIRRFKRTTYLASIFGIFYAMSAYMVAFSWNIMWLDCLVLLPLIMFGLEELIKRKKVRMYTIATGFAILSNYYIGIMLAIFIVFYALYLLIFEPRSGQRRSAGEIIASILRVFWYSILAGLMAMCVVMPAIFALSGTASSDFDFPSKFTIYNNFLAVFSKAGFLTEPAIFSGHFPNIYCTCAAFILIPLFWVNGKIKLRRKIGLTLLLAIFLFSFNTNITTYIWHGFHFPNSLPCRQSFIFIAIVLLIAYEAVLRIKDYKPVMLIVIGILGILSNVLFYILFNEKEFTLLTGATTAGFVAAYTVLLILWTKGKFKAGTAVFIMILLCAAEAAVNTPVTGYSTASYAYYTNDNQVITKLLDNIEDDDFYRVEKTDRRTKNDGTWSNYKSASIFSSSSLAGLSDFYEGFGMQSSMNSFSYYGRTPLSTMILGVRYELSKSPVIDDLKLLVADDRYHEEKYSMFLYQNLYALGLGYTVNEDINEKMSLDPDNPFISQNSFAYAAGGVENLFDIEGHALGEKARGKFTESGRGFIFITNEVETANVTLVRDGEELSDNEYNDLENPQIIDLREIEEGDEIIITAVDEDDNTVDDLDVILAVMDLKKLETLYDTLSKNQLDITEFEEGHVKGTVDIPDGRALFTTIPCDDGWEITVDGEKTDYTKFEDAFILLELEPGEHEIVFDFEVPGRKAGVIIALFAFVLFMISLIFRKGFMKKPAPIVLSDLYDAESISDTEFWKNDNIKINNEETEGEDK